MSATAAIAAIRSSASILELVIGTPKVYPVIARDHILGEIHRFLGIEGIDGFMGYQECAERGPFEYLPNLSGASDDAPLHDRCFGPLDAEVDA